MTETWLPWCQRIDGPPDKQGYYPIARRSLDQIEGDVKHSAEGSWAALLSEINKAGRRASWTFSMRKDGHTVQHYPLESITWHCGAIGDLHTETEMIGNLTLVGIEHEGKVGEPLTIQQMTSTIRISEFLRDNTYAGKNPPELAVNLWEHNWISGVTSCPSGRIPWQTIVNALIKEDDMPLNDDDLAKVRQQVIDVLRAKPEFNIPGRLAAIEAKLEQGTPINITLNADDYKAIAKAVNDDQAARMKE